jgi:hypothetical protein
MQIDQIRHRAKQVLFDRGLRMNLPYAALNAVAETIDIAVSPVQTARRRWLANQIRTQSPWRNFIPRSEGYRILTPNELPGIDRLLAAAQAIAARQVPLAAPKPKPPATFVQMMTAEELARHPEIIETATQGPIVEAATDYLGFLPRLYHVGLWLSRPMADALTGSQLYHLDKPDTGVLSLFINVTNVGPGDGPFMFYPAEATRRVRTETDYERRSFVSGDIRGEEFGRLKDDAVKHCTGTAPISMVGPAGSSLFCDTSVCLHAGSRCETGNRIMLVLRYAPSHRPLFNYDPVLNGAIPDENPTRRMVMGRA